MTAAANCTTSILANVRLMDGEAADIVMQSDRITGIAAGLADTMPAATRIEGDGLLALLGLVDGHMHLDKTLTGCVWMGHRAGPERISRIEKEKELRDELPPVVERAANLVRCCIAHGTTAIRTHVDVDPDLGLSHVHALAEVREQFAGHVDIQIVACPQLGVMRCPGTADLLEAGLSEGADLLGGAGPDPH